MKKLALGMLLLISSSSAFAVAPGGPNCGWGNMLFAGKTGTGYHLLGTLFNNSSGNNTFGRSSGTNGCDTNGRLTYGGENWLAFAGLLTEFTEAVAKGEGEALNAVAVMFGIDKHDQATFAEITHANFNALFPSENVTAEEVMQTLVKIMKADKRLAKYVA
jgi:hypothetical protein